MLYNVVFYILFSYILAYCRRVRSLETDLQYEERVTAEIENFLREQLVSNLDFKHLTFEINAGKH
jgi:hypothetical protein